MDENSLTSALIAKILREDEEELNNRNDDSGWQTVSYPKRNRRAPKHHDDDLNSRRPNGLASRDVFRSIEEHSEERRRKLLEAQMAAAGDDDVPARAKRHSDDEESDEEGGSGLVANGGAGEVKKLAKPKKPKKPKVTVAEAASKIDAADLGAFLIDITASYESQQDIQLIRFADYFGRAFASVSSAQFPWLKTFKESTVVKLVDIPLIHISDDVYKTSVDWLGQRSLDALGSFVLWSLDSIFADLASHQGAVKGSKKAVQQAPSKSQVAIFVVLAMVLRRKPDILITLLPTMKENPKYQGQDKLPVTAWMIAQASQGDLVVGLFMWAHALLPLLSSKSSNPQSRDLILQLAERILSASKARTILLNGAVRKGERVVSPSALDLLMRVTFPASSSRVKATERFEAIYPTLKEVALAGSAGSKATKQLAVQIMNIVVKAAGEGNSNLSEEASGIFIWCLTQNPECYKQWDMIYLDHLEASVAVLRKLAADWKEHSSKHPTLDQLRETLKSFRQKNERALAKEGDEASRSSLLKEADKNCKVVLGRVSRGNGCVKGLLFVSVALAAGAFAMSQDVQSWDMKKLSELLNIHSA